MLAHARRQFAEVVKALPKEKKDAASDTIAHQALPQIAAIYHLDNELSELPPDERKLRRQFTIKPLVEAYFAWLKVSVQRKCPQPKPKTESVTA